MTVPVRYIALVGAAALVLGLGVYLLLEVRARPAAASAAPGRPIAVREPGASESAPGTAGNPVPRDPAPRDERNTPALEPESPPARPGRNPREALTNGFRQHPAPEGIPPDQQPHRLAEVMDEANRAYDRGDLDEAKAIAQKVLFASPDNVRMLRVVVSASCITGEVAEAQKAYLLLPPADRAQMRARCGRYGVSFTE